MAEQHDLEEKVLEGKVLAFAGRPARPPYTARYEVNEAMIRHWTDAIGDRCPDYPELAPPAMLAIWTMPGLASGPPAPGALDELVGLLGENGYAGVVATNLTQEFERYLKPGELVTASPVIEAVVGPRKTALGSGFFLDVRTDFTVEGGAPVGRSTMRMLRYRPAAGQTPKGRRPRPVMNQDTSFFWEGAAVAELRIQRCQTCGLLRHPPRPMCSSCHSLEWDWVVSSGRGTVYSYVVHHAPQMPGLETPFIGVLVDLEEGSRLVSNLVGCEPDAVSVGMPVEVLFRAVDEGVVLPFFRPAGGEAREVAMATVATGGTGERLPELTIAITRTLIVAGALATRDFQDVHHDTQAAQRRGLTDIIMNVYTSEGLVTRYVSEWAGPGSRLEKISLSLGVPNHPGDTMLLTGEVTSREGRSVEVQVRGANALGEHVRATVVVDQRESADA